MELKDILVVSLATLIILVVTHFAVYWVVRTLYPPAPAPVAAPVATQAEVPKPIFVQQTIPVTEQHVNIPTYEAPVSMEAPRQEGATPIGELPRDPVQRDTGLAATNP